jgi:hypothetical protein
MHLGDWIHPPSPRMQQSPRFPADTSALSPCRLSATFLAASLPRHSAGCTHQPTNISNPERSEGSAFLLATIASPLAPSHSAVDTSRVLPYSAPANEPANPSPPSSSRHRAALDEVCIADSLTQDSHHPLAQRPSGFFVFMPCEFDRGSESRSGKSRRSPKTRGLRCNSTSPKRTGSSPPSFRTLPAETFSCSVS